MMLYRLKISDELAYIAYHNLRQLFSDFISLHSQHLTYLSRKFLS
jgi:hypothetical protein